MTDNPRIRAFWWTRAQLARAFAWMTHFERRRLEWTLAVYTLYFGIGLLMPAQSMSSSTFVGTLSLMSELGWGVAYSVVGVIHMVALHINGRAAWTPFARLAVLAFNSQVFLALCLSLVPANPWGTGVMTYGAIAIGFCGVAIIAAAQDCGKEIAIWRRRDAGI